MASSSSVGNRDSTQARRRVIRTRCDCGDLVGKWTSWSPGNPGRRFIGCPNFRDVARDCNYFAWLDPPLPSQWYKDMLLDFHLTGSAWKLEDFERYVDDERVDEAMEVGPVVQAPTDWGSWKTFDWKHCVCLVVIVLLLLKLW